jgi:hypothetical protein
MLTFVRHFTDEERRARLARRHGLAPGHRHPDVASATTAMTAWHATEAATVHLAARARVDDVTVADVDRALYDDRSVVKQLAMRRTLFGFPRDLLPAVWGSAAARVAEQQRKNLVKFLRDGDVTDDPDAWITEISAEVLRVMAGRGPVTNEQLRDLVPALDSRITLGTPGKKWGGSFPVGRWVVGTLGAQGRLLRAENAGHWRLNKPTWVLAEEWLGESVEPLSAETGYAELVRRWLWTFGPGTETDIVWWLGATKTAVRRALADLDAEQVTVEPGDPAWVLPGDTAPEPPLEPWAGLLPTLDPTVMGWKQRGFYLDPDDVPYLFDTNGNGGNTAWWDGGVVGAWAQDDDGVVHVLPRAEVEPRAAAALEIEAERLTAWLDGVRVVNVYASPQMKGARLS